MHGILSTSEFQISLLLAVALAGYILAARFGQSAVIGEILLGIVVGPSLLGIIPYGNFIKELAKIGAVVLLFVVGLEFDLKDIIKPRYFLIAAIGVLLPWGAGYAVVFAMGYTATSAIFVGTALTATSIAITANVLKEMGKLDTEVAKTIIGAAVIDDVLGLIALSVSVGMSLGSFSALSLAFLVLKSIAFFTIGGALGFFLLRRAIAWLDRGRFASKYPEIPFILAMVIAFAYSATAELIGLSSIVGAFLAGSCIGGIKLVNGRSYEEGSEYIRIIFSSIFFVSLGVAVDLRLVGPSSLLLFAVITLLAIATKLVGCGLPALIVRMRARDALAVGFGMSPRGEVAMIVALIGLEAGVIGQEIYVAIILMSLLTTLIAPFTLKPLLR
jgi:Kef-type K+ transport system membrane component KefB